ncbi:polysaccharide lyase family 8 protein [Multifurca ochricompacta]|uniref:Polysaccharide lyase family 8 protein n=1 Tax=Multifurca ochricompacta TaxID=376703 RepID=A0AAD4QTQ7_9AGAM|nr:polysaccharide lyase family 8 protein [Multifurca ochricompacta]
MVNLALSLLYFANLALCLPLGTFSTLSTASLLPSSTLVRSTPPSLTSSTPTTTALPSLSYTSNISKVISQSEQSTSSLSRSTSTSLNVSSTSTLSPTTSSSPTTPVSPVSSQDSQDMQTVFQRRLDFIIASATQVSHIASWLQTLGSDGSWPASEINYTTGCPAQRANWPAGNHWARILTLSAAWHGGLGGAEQYAGSLAVASAISSAMNFWFSQDFTVPGCLDQGGTSVCPCGTPGFWNTNWFSNVILVPKLVGESCLLFNTSLTPAQFNSCTTITTRAYDTFYQGKSFLTGANILDVAKIGIDLALLSSNASLITEAYGRINAEIVIEPGVMVDGIKPDGSFGQHGGLLYNGNYGKDYSNDVLELQIDAAGTQYSADITSRGAFETLIDGDQWMVYLNVETSVLHWDFSVLPRFISFPVIDAQATANLNINISEILQLGELWDSSTMVDMYNNLVEPTKDANEFYNNDYMVQRGHGYVSTLKMYSTRTKNTECVNSQNPFGFHLADGTLYTYLQGDEYEDISAAWDWNLIPGTTIDYGATPLDCAHASWTGLESFVGGVSNGKTGVAAMQYLNPLTQAFSWQKAWFFLDDDTQYVMIANLISNTNASIYSVLDQKRHSGNIYVDDDVFNAPGNQTFNCTVSSLWHRNVGYLFDSDSTVLSLSVGERTGAWSTIGTSAQPPETVDLFAAWIEHQDLTQPVSYTIFPGTTFDSFRRKSEERDIIPLQNDAYISAIFDADYDTISAVFWDISGGTLLFECEPSFNLGPASITVSGNVALILNFRAGTLTVSDPSQSLTSVDVQVNGITTTPLIFTVDLPSGPGGFAGISVTQQFSYFA